MITICIDAGHGQTGNPYPQRSGYYEGTQMHKLAQMIAGELRQYDGVTVILTRPEVTDNPSLSIRGKAAAGCELMLSVHSNAADNSGRYTSARGVSVIDSNKRPNKALADAVGQAVAETMGNHLRGVTYRDYYTGTSWREPHPSTLDYYGVIRNAMLTDCKSALIVEHGFHTNEADSALLVDEGALRKIAQAEAQTIAKHYGLRRPTPTPAPAPAPANPTTYTVRKGDTLSKIGKALGIPWRDIAAVNGISAPYKIYAGQVLRLASEATRTYIVRDGDNPWRIAAEQLGDGKRYVEIERLNGLAGEYTIHTGQELTLPIN